MLTDKEKYVRIKYMISYDEFTQYLLNGQLKNLHFRFLDKEYVIARKEVDDVPFFIFTAEGGEAVEYSSVKSLLKHADVGGRLLEDVWDEISPVCHESLADDGYVLVSHGDALGRVVCSTEGTYNAYARYATMLLIPSIASAVVLIVVLLVCTLFVAELSWTFFGIAAAIVAGAFIVSQLIFFSNTKKYHHGNPRAYLYLLSEGAVLMTTRFEYEIPYKKILRLDTEAGISIVTMGTVYSFTADNGKEICEALTSVVAEVKAKKHDKKAN